MAKKRKKKPLPLKYMMKVLPKGKSLGFARDKQRKQG